LMLFRKQNFFFNNYLNEIMQINVFNDDLSAAPKMYLHFGGSKNILKIIYFYTIMLLNDLAINLYI